MLIIKQPMMLIRNYWEVSGPYLKENKERPLKFEPCINFRPKLTWGERQGKDGCRLTILWGQLYILMYCH